MMAIAKNNEPKSLTKHRAASHSTYDNYAAKADLRASLVAEQRGICCYCMGRIRAESDSMKIEHWQCQDRYDDRQLNYSNFLAACRGGEGRPKAKQHCDTRKGNADLKWNPSDPAHAIEKRIRYLVDGTIESPDTEFCDQLNDVLNLNLRVLKNNRKGVLDAVIAWWKSEKARLKGPVPKATFERKLTRIVGDGGELAPYSGVAAWWLQQRIGRLP